MLTVGASRRGKSVVLSDEERSRHVHVLGASGTGKSKLLESMIRQDIKAGHGLCLIDPHGTLADEIVKWAASRRVNDFRRIHVIEPADLSRAFGFNPLRMDGQIDTDMRVGAMVSAFEQVWGGEDTHGTPLLRRCLRSVFYALAAHNLTLAEAPELIRSESPTLRRKLTDNLPDSAFGAEWREFNSLSPREFRESFSSTHNRMLEFLGSAAVRRIIGQRDSALDLRQVMDNREVLIVNLAPRGVLSLDNARLIGTLLTSELFLLALSRDPETARRAPFYLYIDECYNFLTSSIEQMLDQTRKFGLHLILAHQRLGQLGDERGPIYNGVMTGGQTKIVFGGLTDADAEKMAREVMRGSVNLERPKHILDKPVVVDEVPYYLESESTTEAESRTTGSSSQQGWSSSRGSSEAYGPDGRTVTGYGLSSGSGDSGAWGASESSTQGTSRTRGWSQTLKPVRQIMPTSVYSLEEEMHLAILKLRELPTQAAIVKRRGHPPLRIKAPEVPRVLVTPDQVSRFREQSFDGSAFISLREEVDREMAARQAAIIGAKSASGEETFWYEEEST